jgi:hypothetical protein
MGGLPDGHQGRRVRGGLHRRRHAVELDTPDYNRRELRGEAPGRAGPVLGGRGVLGRGRPRQPGGPRDWEGVVPSADAAASPRRISSRW